MPELSEELPELAEDMQLSDADGEDPGSENSGSEDPDAEEESDCEVQARKTVDQIIAEANPMKSAKFYEVAWEKFTEWRAETSSVPLGRDRFYSIEPTEEEYIGYFHFLKVDKEYQSSSLWSTFSKLNSVHQVCILITQFCQM